jgi:peptide chain release factor 3
MKTLRTEYYSDTSAEVSAESRRTFAIISHPDAGKTTITEKLLHASGAIRLAGQVKARGERRRTQSDWMEIEQARGISISSSVMTFDCRNLTYNLLDTPGHQDFSEDTYRTLTAVDSVIMVIDAAKGIEAQTLKLFEVCRLRDIPIITFINKCDRDSRDLFGLLDEIESTLALEVAPINWPVGTGSFFHGCYNFRKNVFSNSSIGRGAPHDAEVSCDDIRDQRFKDCVMPSVYDEFVEEATLASSEYAELQLDAYLEGYQTPVIFGSGLKDYGIRDLLDLLGEIAPSPRIQPAEPAPVSPEDDDVTGFVFKVQANMDPKHRDRIAFLRICSGSFLRGMKLRHSRTGKSLSVHNPIFFFAQDRELADHAAPGDIIGIPNHGTIQVGDAFTSGREVRFTGIPNFAPEILCRVRLKDPMKAKQMRKALEDLSDEGVAQLFRPVIGGQWIVGVVGQLQLDVLTSRIAVEYGINVEFELAPFNTVRWVTSESENALQDFLSRNRSAFAEDRNDAPVLLVRNLWELDRQKTEWPMISFSRTSERSSS